MKYPSKTYYSLVKKGSVDYSNLFLHVLSHIFSLFFKSPWLKSPHFSLSVAAVFHRLSHLWDHVCCRFFQAKSNVGSFRNHQLWAHPGFPVGSQIHTRALAAHDFCLMQRRCWQYWKSHVWFLSDLSRTPSVQHAWLSKWGSPEGFYPWSANSPCWRAPSCYCPGKYVT